MKFTRGWLILILAWGLLVVAYFALSRRPGGARTPGRAFDQFQRLSHDDWPSAFRVMTEPSQHMVLEHAYQAVISAGERGSPSLRPRVDAFLEKHAISLELRRRMMRQDVENRRETLQGVVRDPVSFVRQAFDLVSLDLKHWQDAGELLDLTYHGPRAQGSYQVGPRKITMRFRRVDGRWYCDLRRENLPALPRPAEAVPATVPFDR